MSGSLRKRRIAYLTNRLLDWRTREPCFGGGERYCLALGTLLRDLGFEVTFFQPAHAAFTAEYYGFDVMAFPASEHLAEFHFGAANTFHRLSADYDHVLINAPTYASGRMRRDAVVICHGVWFDHEESPPPALFRTPEWFAHLYRAFAQPRNVVSVDTNAINLVRALWPELAGRITYVPNWVDTDVFRPPARRAAGAPGVIFPRRADVTRGVRLLPAILEHVSHDCRFVWVGAGEPDDETMLADVARRDPRLAVLHVAFEEMPDRYRDAEICVIPTVAAEGTSLSCLEGMASGCAMIATDVGGLPNLIQPDVNGLLVAPEPRAIAAAINRLIEHPDERARLQQAGRASAEKFNIAIWRARWTALIEEWGWLGDGASSEPESAPAAAWVEPLAESVRAAPMGATLGDGWLAGEEAVPLLAEVARKQAHELRRLQDASTRWEAIIAERDRGIAWLRDELAIAQRKPAPEPTSSARRAARRIRAGVRRLARSVLPIMKAALTRPSAADATFDSKAGSPPRRASADGYAEVPIAPGLQDDDSDAIYDVAPPDGPRRRADVICFAIIDWDFRFQRPQQIMSEFAAHGHRVFYLSTTRFLPPNAEPRVAVTPVATNVYEVHLAAERSPDVYGEVMEGANGAAMLHSLAELRRTFHVEEAIGYVMLPSWGGIALECRRRWGWHTLYDCMDEWESFPGIQRPILEMEAQLVERSDLLVVTAQRLYDKWRIYGRPMVLARNAVDWAFYERSCRPNALLRSLPRPVVGYFGAIAEWFDIDLMADIAARRPGYTFVLLGGVFGVEVARLRALPNVELLGQQPYADMPRYLYHFDACIIPFRINAITEATDPVKLYEYLAGGKPVVAVALPELEAYRDHVAIAEGPDDFLAKLDAAITDKDPGAAAQRRALAREHTWSARYTAITNGLVEVVPRASIVVITHDNLVLTKLCLESVIANTAYPSYEVIVVDNGSADGTPAYLRHLASVHPHVRAILNPHNAGFAAANNQGIARSTGDYLVLLNNDTIVPPGWLGRLVRHLRHDEVGMVGPVTNFVGNEAKVPVSYRTWAEMEAFACSRSWAHDEQVADIHMLAMFCVAMRRDTFADVGPLDERFGIGMFEDDDYSHRVRAKGYRVICAADVFVHHFGQASFKKLIASGDYDRLFDENRRHYEGKWQVDWVPHVNAPLDFRSFTASAR